MTVGPATRGFCGGSAGTGCGVRLWVRAAPPPRLTGAFVCLDCDPPQSLIRPRPGSTRRLQQRPRPALRAARTGAAAGDPAVSDRRDPDGARGHLSVPGLSVGGGGWLVPPRAAVTRPARRTRHRGLPGGPSRPGAVQAARSTFCGWKTSCRMPENARNRSTRSFEQSIRAASAVTFPIALGEPR